MDLTETHKEILRWANSCPSGKRVVLKVGGDVQRAAKELERNGYLNKVGPNTYQTTPKSWPGHGFVGTWPEGVEEAPLL